MNTDRLGKNGLNGCSPDGCAKGRPLPELERERNRRYVEFKKACLKYRKAAEGKGEAAVPGLLSEMEAKREAFVASDSLLPENKRFWKKGFRENG